MKESKFETHLEYAQWMDVNDPIKDFRQLFHIPNYNGKPAVYLCGNSLGLQPKSTAPTVAQELSDWATLGIEGHMKAKNAWINYHKSLSPSLAALTGAYPHEVVAMNSLTTNLHLMLACFYKPDKKRFKIITEAGSFSSDIHALISQVKMHGLDPEACIVEVRPRTEEYLIRESDIINAIDAHGPELCLVLIGAVNYYTGQAFDIASISRAAHAHGAFAGFDLAHAIGNVPLQLHLAEADFAVWCSYKYLNSGPGGVGGLFIHEKYGNNADFPRLTGWWGHREEDRFLMKRDFLPSAGADGFQLSNVPILLMAAHKAALQIFDDASFKAIIKKGTLLTGYLYYLITQTCRQEFDKANDDFYQIRIITPEATHQRGNQLSLMVYDRGKELFDALTQKGFIVDWRVPGVIRIAPTPLYNTFTEVYQLAQVLSGTCIYI